MQHLDAGRMVPEQNRRLEYSDSQMTEELIGWGRVAKVYKVVYKVYVNPGTYARKEFSAGPLAWFWNHSLFQSPHIVDTKEGQEFHYNKRILGHFLSRFHDTETGNGVCIVSALRPSKNGFVSPYIEGHHPRKEELAPVYRRIRPLRKFFKDIEMPTFSFDNPFSDSNMLLDSEGRIHIVDYEQAVALPDGNGNITYDLINPENVYAFIRDNRRRVADKFGMKDAVDLELAFEATRYHQRHLDIRPRLATRIGEIISRSLSKREVDALAEALYSDGRLSAKEYQEYLHGERGENIRIALENLSVHVCLTVLTMPLTPLVGSSSAARAYWTYLNRKYYRRVGDPNKADVHSRWVNAVAAVPFGIGMGAYFIPIAQENKVIAQAVRQNFKRAKKWAKERLKRAKKSQ